MTTAPTKPPPPATMGKAPPPRQSANKPTVATGTHPRFSRITPAKVGHRVVLIGVEGWGKTSAAAHAGKVAIVECRDETGYETLLSAGRVPSVDAVQVKAWPDLLAVIADAAGGGYDVLAIDALSGAERLCHEAVCARDFNGEWGERGFGAYMRGYDLSVTDWLAMLARLEAVRQNGTHVVLLSHAKVVTTKNPMGADYDRFSSDVHHKTWACTHKWADAVLFGTFETIVITGPQEARKSEQLRRGKGIGGTSRVLYTERRDAFDAKNRFGMPEVLDIPNDPAQVWQTIMKGINHDA
ncbi:MAG: ATP-binding protein [Planctomycetes bacterium]|nr:ATP-binding protein [Planctomycetota bacterium]